MSFITSFVSISWAVVFLRFASVTLPVNFLNIPINASIAPYAVFPSASAIDAPNSIILVKILPVSSTSFSNTVSLLSIPLAIPSITFAPTPIITREGDLIFSILVIVFGI